jgi:nucleoid-associated protein YgaU
MALPPTSGGEPPQVKISGHSVPKPGPVLWVIENLQWGTNVLSDFASNGVFARLRQDCVISLLEYRADDRVAFKGIKPGAVTASKTSKGKSGWPKTYTVVKGDTLSKIAAKFYGQPSKWSIIAKANNIRDPNNPRVGNVLTIPAP